MINFACKKLDLDEVMRCGLGLTKTEHAILLFLLDNDWETANDVANKLKISLATAQRSLKNLHSKELIERRQQNLDLGGYLFFYKAKDKDFVKGELKNILSRWVKNVDSSLEDW